MKGRDVMMRSARLVLVVAGIVGWGPGQRVAVASHEIGDMICGFLLGAARSAPAAPCFCSGVLGWNTCEPNTWDTEWYRQIMEDPLGDRWQYQSVPCIRYTDCDHPGLFFCTKTPDNCAATPTGQVAQVAHTWIWIGKCVDGPSVPD